MARQYTKERILDYLDNCVVYNPGCFFMDLEHAYFYSANSRLSLFADDMNWAIVFEKSGYANRTFEIQLELNYFGNRLLNLEAGGQYSHFPYNSRYFSLVTDDALEEVSEDFEMVSPSATRVKLRDEYVAIPNRKEDYLEYVPDILTRDYPEVVSLEDLGRYLAFEYEGLCRATQEELRTSLPLDLPFLMHIDEWHHRAYHNYSPDESATGARPSSYETFPLIADVLISGDPALYRPTLPPTNHWRNWPEAGSL